MFNILQAYTAQLVFFLRYLAVAAGECQLLVVGRESNVDERGLTVADTVLEGILNEGDEH